MRIEAMKTSLASAWVLALGAVSLSGVIPSGAGRASFLGFGLVPVVMMWWFWNPPTATLSESISKARE
jgi:hypothetical protein